MSKLTKSDIQFYNLNTSYNDLLSQCTSYLNNNNISASLYHESMTMGTLYIGQSNTGPIIASTTCQPLTLDSDVVITGRLAVLTSNNIINGFSNSSPSNFILAIDGNETKPSISFINSNGTGFYNNSNIFGITIGGNSLLTFNQTEILPFQNDKVNIGSTGRRIQNIYSKSFLTISDKRLKDNIQDIKTNIPNPCKFINDLSIVSYNFKQHEKLNYGLIIQDIQEVVKNNNIINFDAIDTSDDNNYNLDYNQIHIINIAAVQDLIKENKEIKLKISDLENKIDLLTKYIYKL